ncbi:hypothetical protein GCM10008931_43850 [Oceanobacillus oncorhynchi subsp. oncorhynchi]|uniref:hypothetical protein n=1 Tax=Oceanobacillus oncorhynchi TaxID=545501 RepID=UPI0031CFCAC6
MNSDQNQIDNEKINNILEEISKVERLIYKETEFAESLDFRDREYRKSLKREIDLYNLKLKILENHADYLKEMIG